MLNQKVSILVPFRNTSNYLKACLDSILEQSYTHWELVIVDDHSSDQSYKIVENYAKKDPRIKLLKNKGIGIISALQTAYKSSVGKFITRMDSDDIMQKNKIEFMVNDLSQNGQGFIALGLVKYFCDTGVKEGYKRYEKWLNDLISKGTSFNEIYKECVIPSPCWMVYRSDFEKANGFDSNVYPEDYDLAFRFYEIGLRCIPTKNILHMWRDYPNRTSRISPNYAENSFLELKIHYFLRLSYDSLKTLVLWGAG
ncbi:MAG: glycosyltransferase family 2 protein, partial [Bacteroidota bacterium]|nr:glycosyltransferase family 2 protein [Bacteroidota bacterium]